jgi:hypothetical protein
MILVKILFPQAVLRVFAVICVFLSYFKSSKRNKRLPAVSKKINEIENVRLNVEISLKTINIYLLSGISTNFTILSKLKYLFAISFVLSTVSFFTIAASSNIVFGSSLW